jgi:beta-galactosidase
MGINYFRWDTANFGAEEYWHGMLRHDRSHSPGFDEMVQTMREMKSLGAAALYAPCEAHLALCFDNDAEWALTIQPGQPRLKYMSETVPWYATLAASQAGVDIVNATQDLSRYKVLCAPVMYVVSPQQADRIRSFVQQGGIFIAGFRLGVKDEHSRIVDTPLPGLLHDVMGVELIDYQPIYTGDAKQSVTFTGPLAGAFSGRTAECQIWADILDPKQAEVLATYTGDYAGKAAITSNTYGKGKAFYVGAHLEPADLARVLLTLLAMNGIRMQAQLPPGVEMTRRTSAGKNWIYLLNHNATPQTAKLSGNFKDALDQSTVTTPVSLPAYGVRVLLQS